MQCREGIIAMIPSDVIVLPAGGRWIALNIFARSAIGLDTSSLGAMQDAATLAPEALAAKHGNARFTVWEIYRFPYFACSVANPAWFINDPSQWPPAESLDIAELVKRLSAIDMLIDNKAAYRARFAPKRQEVDHGRYGDFRQQLNQELALNCPDRHNWWTDQKFTPDRRALLENSYKYVQQYNLKRFFAARFGSGHEVIDLGCGTGYYTNLIAATGASAFGIDPARALIDIARATAHPNARFAARAAGQPGGLDDIGDATAHFVFMSDAFLMYHQTSYFPADPELLFADLRRILKKGGSFIICEPHPVFLHQPWLGDPDRPFTLLTEYREKSYTVVGTFEWHLKVALNRGFALTGFEELAPDPAFQEVDERGYFFARQFPLWALYEFRLTV